MTKILSDKTLFNSVKLLLENAKRTVIQAVNTTMVETYFAIGRLIIEEEQEGQIKAKYVSETLKILSKQLTQEFGKGFSVDNLQNMRNFLKFFKNTRHCLVN